MINVDTCIPIDPLANLMMAVFRRGVQFIASSLKLSFTCLRQDGPDSLTQKLNYFRLGGPDSRLICILHVVARWSLSSMCEISVVPFHPVCRQAVVAVYHKLYKAGISGGGSTNLSSVITRSWHPMQSIILAF